MFKILCSNGCSVEVEQVNEDNSCSVKECQGVVLIVSQKSSIV